MTLLAQRWRLGDVNDVEALCRRVLDQQLRRLGAHLQPADYDDALSHLLEQAWQLFRRFDAERNESFAGYAGTYLPARTMDYWRGRFGRTAHHRPPPGSRSLDELDQAETDRLLAGVDDDLEQTHDTGLLEQLSPASRSLALRLVEGYSQADTADRNGTTQKATSAQMQRLREEIEWLTQDEAS